MSQHAGEHMVVPTGILPDLVVIHAKFCLAFLERLLNRPSQPTEPYEQSEARILRSIADEVGVLRLFADRAPDHQPDLRIGHSIFAKSYSFPREVIVNGALGTLRHGSAIPEVIVDALRKHIHAHRFLLSIVQHDFRSILAPVAVLLLNHDGLAHPALGRVRHRHEVDSLRVLLDGSDEIRTLAIDAVASNVFEAQALLLTCLPKHLGGKPRFAPETQLLRHTAFPSQFPMVVIKPLLRHEQPFVNQCVAVWRSVGGKDTNLTIVNFPCNSTVLSGNTDRIVPFLGEPRLIENQHPVFMPNVRIYHNTILRQHSLFFPDNVANEVLHDTSISALDPQSNGLYRLALKLAELTRHIPIKVLPRLTPRETIRKLSMKSPQFFGELADVPGGHLKLRNLKRVSADPDGWQHGLPPSGGFHHKKIRHGTDQMQVTIILTFVVVLASEFGIPAYDYITSSGIKSLADIVEAYLSE